MKKVPLSSDKHPIETERYIIITNQLSDGKAIIYNWINMGIPGAIIYGKQRMGKTKLITYCQHMLNAETENTIPNFHIKWTDHSIKENTFFGLILDAVGHSIPFEGNPLEKRSRLTNYLLSLVEETGQNKVIFFIDDANRLKRREYEWLMDIYNALESYGVNLITFLVGQEDIIDTVQELKKRKALQIVGRFMTDDYRFTGFHKKQSFYDLFLEYDENTEFPKDSGITFTQHYFKNQYKDGFRLINYFSEFLTALDYLQSEYGIVEYKEIPAMYVIKTIENVLKSYGRFGDNVLELTVQHWIDAIENSGYVTASTSLYKDKVIDNSYLKAYD